MFGGHTFDIIMANAGFWLNFSIPVAIALYLAFTHKEYIWKEFGIQVGVTFVYVTVAFFALFSTTTDLMDTEYWGGKATKFEYYEEWKEEVTYQESYSCGTSKNPKTCYRTKTRIDYHSPYWQLKTSNGETLSISRSEYKNASREFGHTEKSLFRSGQVSFGDGDMYYSIPNKLIPTAVAHTFENLVVAAKETVLVQQATPETIEMFKKAGHLKDYPTQYDDKYGAHKLNRIIDTTGVADKLTMRKTLDVISYQYGRSKQVNPIIYIVDADVVDRTFRGVLEAYWNKGKKNDAILILGIDTSNGKVEWSDAIAWTNNTDFLVDCTNKFKDTNVKTEAKKVVARFGSVIGGGYIRKPMEEFAFLKENITLAWYWQLFILLGNIGLSGFVMWKMLTNYESKNGRRWR